MNGGNAYQDVITRGEITHLSDDADKPILICLLLDNTCNVVDYFNHLPVSDIHLELKESLIKYQ